MKIVLDTNCLKKSNNSINERSQIGSVFIVTASPQTLTSAPPASTSPRGPDPPPPRTRLPQPTAAARRAGNCNNSRGVER